MCVTTNNKQTDILNAQKVRLYCTVSMVIVAPLTSVNSLLSTDFVAVQVPDIVSSDTHVFTLVKTETTFTAVGTAWVEMLVSCLQ